MTLHADVKRVAIALGINEAARVVAPAGSGSAGPEGCCAGVAPITQVQPAALAAGDRQRDRASLADRYERLQPPPAAGMVSELVTLRSRRIDQDDAVPDDEIVGRR